MASRLTPSPADRRVAGLFIHRAYRAGSVCLSAEKCRDLQLIILERPRQRPPMLVEFASAPRLVDALLAVAARLCLPGRGDGNGCVALLGLGIRRLRLRRGRGGLLLLRQRGNEGVFLLLPAEAGIGEAAKQAEWSTILLGRRRRPLGGHLALAD